MAIITPDTSEAASSNMEPGTYKAKILDVQSGTSGAGNPKVVVKMEVYDPKASKPRPRTAHIPTSGAGAFNFDRLLRACNLAEDADAIKRPGSNHAFDTDKLVGQELQVVVDTEMYQGEARDRINGYLRA